MKAHPSTFHEKWKYVLSLFCHYHHQRSPNASYTVTNISKWKYVLSLYISSTCLLYSFCIHLIISKCDVFQYVVWGNFIKSVPVRIALLRHRYSPELSGLFSRSFWKWAPLNFWTFYHPPQIFHALHVLINHDMVFATQFLSIHFFGQLNKAKSRLFPFSLFHQKIPFKGFLFAMQYMSEILNVALHKSNKFKSQGHYLFNLSILFLCHAVYEWNFKCCLAQIHQV